MKTSPPAGHNLRENGYLIATKLVSLGSVQSLVRGITEIGSDAGPFADCAFPD